MAASAEIDGRRPGKVRNRTVDSDKHGVTARWDPPNAWEDGSTDGWDVGQVSHYEVDLLDSGNNVIAQDLHVLTTRKRFEVASGTTGLKARIRAIGHDMEYATEDAATGSGTANKAGTLDIADDAVTVDKLYATAITVKHTITGAVIQTASTGARIVMVDVADGSNDRIRFYDASGWAGSLRGFDDLVTLTGGMLIGDTAGESDNFINFTNAGSPGAPTTGRCKVHYNTGVSPNALQARFPNGVVKTVANNS